MGVGVKKKRKKKKKKKKKERKEKKKERKEKKRKEKKTMASLQLKEAGVKCASTTHGAFAFHAPEVQRELRIGTTTDGDCTLSARDMAYQMSPFQQSSLGHRVSTLHYLHQKRMHSFPIIEQDRLVPIPLTIYSAAG